MTQPKEAYTRFDRVVFKWKGGDPQVDAPRGKPFVSLEREVGERWDRVVTEATFADTTERIAGDVWTETFQLDECIPRATYRFVVTGRALRRAGSRPDRYTVISRDFSVGELKIDIGAVHRSTDGVATVRPLYPDPGKDAIVSMPRLVRKAMVRMTLDDGTVVRAYDRTGDGAYGARAGSAAVKTVTVEDKCGNPGA